MHQMSLSVKTTLETMGISEAIDSVKCKSKSSWSYVEILRWIVYYFIPKTNIDCKYFPYEVYTALNGRILVSRDLEFFNKIDPRYGQFFYNEFHSFETNDETDSRILIWQFCRDLLQNPQFNPSVILWVSKSNLVFRINKPDTMAHLWGQVKNNTSMNYEKLSRSLRLARTNGYLKAPGPLYGTHYIHQFGERAICQCNWLKVLREENTI